MWFQMDFTKGGGVGRKRRVKTISAAQRLQVLKQVMAEKTWTDMSYRSATGPWAKAAAGLHMKNNRVNRRALQRLWAKRVCLVLIAYFPVLLPIH